MIMGRKCVLILLRNSPGTFFGKILDFTIDQQQQNSQLGLILMTIRIFFLNLHYLCWLIESYVLFFVYFDSFLSFWLIQTSFAYSFCFVVKFSNVIIEIQMQAQIRTYFQGKQTQWNPDQTLIQNLKSIYQHQQKTITNLSQQITKIKCEQIKKQKLIKNLQQKINQLAPSTSNTSSNFMMASEFKSTFEDFMTSKLPNSMGFATDRPCLYAKCISSIFGVVYRKIEESFNEKIDGVLEIFKLKESEKENNQITNKIKLSLLKVVQENWQTIFPFSEQIKERYTDKSNKISAQILQQLNESLQGEDHLQMRRQLHKLCVYMILQQKKWQFIHQNSAQKIKYFKKQFTSMDGWIKEGEQALMVLKGIEKQGQSHPNIKNFVIPLCEDENEDNYEGLQLLPKDTEPKIIESTQLQQIQSAKSIQLSKSGQLNLQEIERQVQILPLALPQSTLLQKNKYIQNLFSNKQNCQSMLNKKQKKRDKLKHSIDTSLKMAQKSPRNISKKHDQTLRLKKHQLEQIDERHYLLKQQNQNKKKTAGICKASIELSNEQVYLAPRERKNIEQMPVNKEGCKKKQKPQTSRKNSVGKIVNQNYVMNHKDDKENIHSNTSKMKNKEKVYKDIIKEKLLQQRIGDKMPSSFTMQLPRSRIQKDKKKEQTRPLKIQTNAVNKLRQKYIY